MKDNILYIIVIIAVTIMLLYTVDYERKIEELQYELNNKNILIDSLSYDVNRILKLKKLHKRFTYNDRWSRFKSIEMFDVYCSHYNLITSEEIARCWNGGPRGMTNEVTVGYWKKVENQLDI